MDKKTIIGLYIISAILLICLAFWIGHSYSSATTALTVASPTGTPPTVAATVAALPATIAASVSGTPVIAIANTGGTKATVTAGPTIGQLAGGQPQNPYYALPSGYIPTNTGNNYNSYSPTPSSGANGTPVIFNIEPIGTANPLHLVTTASGIWYNGVVYYNPSNQPI